jgi:hypothetical protein
VKRAIAACGLLLLAPVAVAAIASGPMDTQSGATTLAQTEIPADLLGVYVTASYECPGLPWQVLAAIGFVESHHADGRADPTTGQVDPPIIGPAIDGRSGFAAIPDPTSPDGWAHAVGPMQFLTTTWHGWGVVAPDRPPGAVADPNNAWDAIYSAARYLCGGADRLDDLHAAVLRYNNSESYYRTVIDKATVYGLGGGLATDGTLASGSGEAAVAAALTQLGVPYVWGGSTPGVGFDCSGLVQWAYAQIGISLPRVTFDQVLVGVAVDINDLRPGDLIFRRSIRAGGEVVDLGHVALYAGGGLELVAPHTGDVVSLREVQPSAIQAARRVVGP